MEEEPNKIVGSRLKEARLTARLSQAKVGQMLSASQEAISQYERGVTPLTPPDLLKLAKFFNRPVEWFYGVDTPPPVKIEVELGGEVRDLQEILAQVPADELVRALAKQMGIPEKAAWAVYLGLQAAKGPDEEAAGKE